jgi:hypothetical protein
MATVLDSIDLQTLLDLYSDPDPATGSIRAISRMFGVSLDTVYRRLTVDPERYDRALQVKAQLLHDRSVEIMYEPAERIANGEFGERIDPGSIAQQKLRFDGCARLAGILSQRLSERNSRLELAVTASPLSDMIQRLAQTGSAILPAPAPLDPIEGECEDVTPDPDAP